MRLIDRLLATHAGPSAILIRLLVGWVFVSEGIGKFLYAATQGGGRWSLDARMQRAELPLEWGAH